MRKLYIICVLLLAFAQAFCQSATKEQEVIDKVWKGIGGKDKWEASRYIKFTYILEKDTEEVARHDHVWDRYTGFYRIDLTQNDGKQLEVIFNINTKEGKSYIDTAEVPDSINIKLLEKAYSYFINDSYWLLVPAKLEDPGVRITALPDTTINGLNCNVLTLSFDEGVGLTPGDRYWIYVNDKDGHIVRWNYILQDQDILNTVDWEPYINTGELMLSNEKTETESNFSIKFPVIETSKVMDENIFKAPNGLD